MHNKIALEIELTMKDIKRVAGSFLEGQKKDDVLDIEAVTIATGKLKAYVNILKMLNKKYEADHA